MSESVFGCIESGGTKFVCAVGRAPDDVSEPTIIPTADPRSTLEKVIAYFRQAGPYRAFGIASFGPADVNPSSPRFGSILSTPKPGWSNVDIRGAIASAFGVPVGFDTDVAGAALAEAEWGAAAGMGVSAYVTVGTGIGAGIAVNGASLRGKANTEGGHIFPRRHPADLEFPGACPFHGDCLEGLASGPAIEKRWGKSLSHLPQDHVAHEVIASYLAQFAICLIATTAAETVIFGGGVMKAPGLLDRIRRIATGLNRGYFAMDAEIAAMIREPALGTRAGLLGGLLLAQRAAAAIR